MAIIIGPRLRGEYVEMMSQLGFKKRELRFQQFRLMDLSLRTNIQRLSAHATGKKLNIVEAQ
jgi:hypothetical protein